MKTRFLTRMLLLLAAFFYMPGAGFASDPSAADGPTSGGESSSSDADLPRRPTAVRG